MSIKRVIAVGLIFVLACAGWWTLASVLAMRSSNFFSRLGTQVEALWGVPIHQQAPSLWVTTPGTDQKRPIMPAKNKIDVVLDVEHRKKGLIWYPTYSCEFDGTYTVTNPEEVAQKINMHFSFPHPEGTYDKFALYLDAEDLRAPVDRKEGISELIEVQPGESREFRITYRTRGIREWHYAMDPDVGRVQDLELAVTTNFKDIDFTDESLSPMTKNEAGDGMKLTWIASNLITSQDVGLIVPDKLNPGPLTSRITFFAPVCLLFFFVLVATINILYKVDIHPMHYLFVAAGFFAFHLLLAYMAGLIPIYGAFIISALTSVGLVTGYLATALRGKLPWKIATAGQLFFLVLFSYSFFFKGITGLIVAIGCVVTLAILMTVTAHVDWNEVFARKQKVRKMVPSVSAPPPVPAE